MNSYIALFQMLFVVVYMLRKNKTLQAFFVLFLKVIAMYSGVPVVAPSLFVYALPN